jgi:tetrahydromethanopterin S-methyltransferase subunit G
MRDISDRWHKAGHVPRADFPKVEARLKKVEAAIAEAEAEEWRKNDPSRKSFAAETANKFQESVDRLEAEVAAAKASGSKKLADLEKQLENAKAMLEALLKHA